MSSEVEKLKHQCDYLQKEIESLKHELNDANEIIRLNKQQLSICYDPNLFDKSSESKAALSLLKFIQEENKLLLNKIDKLAYERNLAFDKAFIFEQISESNQKVDQQMVENLLLTIKELKIKLNSTANTNKEVLGVIYMEKYIAHPDNLTISHNNTVQQMNTMLLKYKQQIEELIDQKNDLAQLNFNLSNEILKIKTQRFTPKNQGRSFFSNTEDPSRFINNLVQLQRKLFFDDDSMDEKNQMQQSGLFSPLFSPSLPQKVKRQSRNMVRDFEEPDKVVPRLDLTKAQQIQQFNIKRMQILTNKMGSEAIEQKLVMIQEELIRTKNKYHAQLVLNQQLEQLLTEYKFQIIDLQAVNQTLINSNVNYEEKWQQLFQQFQFYKDFYLEYKDNTIKQDFNEENQNSKFQFEKIINSSKHNQKNKQSHITNPGVSIINYQEENIPFSQPRLPTERFEEANSLKVQQYKQYILNMALEVVQIDLNKLEQKKDPQEGHVRIKRSFSNVIEYSKTKQ